VVGDPEETVLTPTAAPAVLREPRARLRRLRLLAVVPTDDGDRVVRVVAARRRLVEGRAARMEKVTAPGERGANDSVLEYRPLDARDASFSRTVRQLFDVAWIIMMERVLVLVGGGVERLAFRLPYGPPAGEVGGGDTVVTALVDREPAGVRRDVFVEVPI